MHNALPHDHSRSRRTHATDAAVIAEFVPATTDCRETLDETACRWLSLTREGPQAAAVVALRAAGHSYQDIAARLGIHRGTVPRVWTRAVKALLRTARELLTDPRERAALTLVLANEPAEIVAVVLGTKVEKVPLLLGRMLLRAFASRESPDLQARTCWIEDTTRGARERRLRVVR